MNQAVTLLRKFQTHPASVGESYFGHMLFALRFAGVLLLAALAALVHALVPPLCETTASRLTCRLADQLRARAADRG